jgi:hypothetical protein
VAGLLSFATTACDGAASGPPAAQGGFHGWCVNATSSLFIVLQDTGRSPSLLAGTDRIQATRVVQLHHGAQLSYYPLPGRRIPAQLFAIQAGGAAEPVYATACSTTPPSTA